MRQLIREATGISPTSSTIIDLVFTNSDYAGSSGCMSLNISDHLATFVTRKKHFQKSKKIKFEGRSYRNYNRDNFQRDLIGEDWDGFYQCQDPNLCWDTMYNLIVENLENYCPTKTYKVKEVADPWISREALELIKDKDRAMARTRRSSKPEDWLEAKRQRNRVGKIIQNMKK